MALSHLSELGHLGLAGGVAVGARGWNVQPDGGLSGLGISPSRIGLVRVSSTNGSGMGTAASSA